MLILYSKYSKGKHSMPMLILYSGYSKSKNAMVPLTIAALLKNVYICIAYEHT